MIHAVFRGPTTIVAMLFCTVAHAEVFELPPPGNDVVGAVATISARADDTLLDIARRHGLGYEDMLRANPEVDMWLPGEGTEVVLPSRYVLPPGPRRGVILNLAEYRLYYFPEPRAGDASVVMTFPMSIGRMDWETPLGNTRIISKVRNPAWYPPESVRAEHAADGDPLPRIVPPGPQNPLGRHAMRLDIPGGAYLIHGTNRPAGVGMRVSHGCIRMFPEDIEFLFSLVDIGAPVRIVNQPVKVGWDGDELVLEVHRTLEVAVPPPADYQDMLDGPPVAVDAIVPEPEPAQAAAPRDAMTALTEQFVAATGERPGELDWDLAEVALERADGIPVAVGKSKKNAATSAASE